MTELLYTDIYPDLQRKEEEVINAVLRQLLEREPQIEDYKRCSKIHHQQDEQPDYHLAYDDVMLGKVLFGFLGNRITITFKPYYAGNL